jgi:hypothetical protein
MGTKIVGLLLSDINPNTRQTLIQVCSIKFREHLFSGSEFVTCGRTDVAIQTATFLIFWVLGKDEVC